MQIIFICAVTLRKTRGLNPTYENSIRESPNLQPFKFRRIFSTRTTWVVYGEMGTDIKERQLAECQAVQALMTDAQLKSEAIRKRLADVARDLRAAAEGAGPGSENLLNLASRFERQSQAGDNA